MEIAVVRLDKIGDLILTTPAIASLKATHPGSKLTVIASVRNKVVLENSPHVDEIWEWKWDDDNVSRLRGKGFDRVIAFSPTAESYKLVYLSRAKIRAGYIYGSRTLIRFFSSFWLNKRLICKIDQKDLEKKWQEVPHEVEQNLNLVKYLENGKAVLSEELVVRVSESDKKWAREALGEKGWIAVHFAKAWLENLPQDFLFSLLEKLSMERKVFVTSGPDETSLASLISFPENVKRFENLSFHKWAALLGFSDACISTNTGAIHVAASQNVPVVAVFEPRFFAYHSQRWRPWQVPHVTLRKDDSDLSGKIIEQTRKLPR